MLVTDSIINPPYNIETKPPKRWLLSFLIPEKQRFQLNQ
ncbi:hypothetical protein NTHI1209_00026 [Haemophilus influenzae]|uniref:Uncharacterized protein n=1 Tax=Haemophilus influenzae TaxID=727 RepID=A0A158T0G8_HAEIF|nr:hypothetical protein NTHI1209_00026 [Haemophilus influenzae]